MSAAGICAQRLRSSPAYFISLAKPRKVKRSRRGFQPRFLLDEPAGKPLLLWVGFSCSPEYHQSLTADEWNRWAQKYTRLPVASAPKQKAVGSRFYFISRLRSQPACGSSVRKPAALAPGRQ